MGKCMKISSYYKPYRTKSVFYLIVSSLCLILYIIILIPSDLLCCERTRIHTHYLLEYTVKVVWSVISHFIRYLCHRLVTISKQFYGARYALVVYIRGISNARVRQYTIQVAYRKAEFVGKGTYRQILIQMSVDIVEHWL